MEEIRLQKYLSDCGVLSRRAAEKAILAGEITVNGEPPILGQKINPIKDEIRFRGRAVRKPRGTRYTYLMLNKPTGYVTTLSDEKGRRCVADLVSDVGVRVYPVGRLDMDSEGLLLLTNDGELTNLLTHPRHQIPKIYHVRLTEQITKEQLALLRAPMTIDGYEIQPVEVELLARGENGALLQMTLFEGRNRQIRKMCETASLTVKRLRRIAMGKLELGELRVGTWRFLSAEEVKYLKNGGKEHAGDQARTRKK